MILVELSVECGFRAWLFLRESDEDVDWQERTRCWKDTNGGGQSGAQAEG